MWVRVQGGGWSVWSGVGNGSTNSLILFTSCHLFWQLLFPPKKEPCYLLYRPVSSPFCRPLTGSLSPQHTTRVSTFCVFESIQWTACPQAGSLRRVASFTLPSSPSSVQTIFHCHCFRAQQSREPQTNGSSRFPLFPNMAVSVSFSYPTFASRRIRSHKCYCLCSSFSAVKGNRSLSAGQQWHECSFQYIQNIMIIKCTQTQTGTDSGAVLTEVSFKLNNLKKVLTSTGIFK